MPDLEVETATNGKNVRLGILSGSFARRGNSPATFFDAWSWTEFSLCARCASLT
jgi:hypothetical protein